MEILSKAKVQPNKIAKKIDEITGRTRPQTPVDDEILSLLASISNADGTASVSQRSDVLASLGHLLRQAQTHLMRRDSQALDGAARDLSLEALKIGASRLLSSAIEVQGIARIGEFSVAADILGRMELELVEIHEHYFAG